MGHVAKHYRAIIFGDDESPKEIALSPWRLNSRNLRCLLLLEPGRGSKPSAEKLGAAQTAYPELWGQGR